MPDARVDTIVRGGQVVTSSQVYDAAIAISGEKIVALGPESLLPPADRYIDAEGKLVLPGLIDCHVHLDRIDDYALGSRAAAYAGLTTLIPFGNYDVEADEPLPAAIHRTREEVNAAALVDFGFHFILQNRPSILNGLRQAMELGVKSYKMFMTYKKRPYRMCDDDYICKTMEMVAAGGGLLQLHCESGNIIEYLENKLIAEGHTHPTDFPAACPDWAEEEAINRAIQMGAATRCPTYVVHLSTQLGLERIKRAQAIGQTVWTETCPHYLLLSDAEMASKGPLAKIGPPLRPDGGPDREALWRGLELGQTSIVSSDHAPYPYDLKQVGWDNIFVTPDGASVPFGSPGIETIVSLMYSEGVVKRELPIWWLARVMSENPARIFGLYPRKGTIQVGSDADLLIMDPAGDRIITAKDHQSNAGYSLFEGWQVKGRPWMTLLRGQVLLNQGKLEQKPGYGRFLSCEGPRAPIGGPVR
ncbi:MAG: amidohydrolase family protein [Dehalococcoidia bacterium]|jgi:dihydropyrimidinase|nr:amidohydrolase family protein [Dehalococcoidia bacterium]MDP7084631.1 amidohydrolase family protein [Dehalococcoidia bacterium]MDP7201486.1 amidohydrolase family protein [Dehalococcoidia bacterium]MDP7509350.1 amidohydrolase family protein [Dehalococcoidia bacterium]HJN86061.1 amidohydrolase family protein [Dehalococcoidia bacterium]